MIMIMTKNNDTDYNIKKIIIIVIPHPILRVIT